MYAITYTLAMILSHRFASVYKTKYVQVQMSHLGPLTWLENGAGPFMNWCSETLGTASASVLFWCRFAYKKTKSLPSSTQVSVTELGSAFGVGCYRYKLYSLKRKFLGDHTRTLAGLPSTQNPSGTDVTRWYKRGESPRVGTQVLLWEREGPWLSAGRNSRPSQSQRQRQVYSGRNNTP